MRSTRLINARSASVPRFNGRYPASISFPITFTTASASEPAAAGARRRTDGSADPRLCPESRLVLLHRISATNDGVRRLAARAAAHHRAQGRRQTIHGRSGAVCTSAPVFHRSRNIGEAQPLEQMQLVAFVGAESTIAEGLQKFVDATEADELIATAQIYDHAARVRDSTAHVATEDAVFFDQDLRPSNAATERVQ